MTYLTVSIFVRDIDAAVATSARAAEGGADMVEFRVDAWEGEADALASMVERSALPCIVTCRAAWEGGQYEGDDAARAALLKGACSGSRKPAYVDFELACATGDRGPQGKAAVDELAALLASFDAASTGLILSTHDFETRPADLTQRMEATANHPACRVAKVAWRARSLRDNLEAFELLEQRVKPTIAVCMGEDGLASRVLAKKFGGLVTFAAIDSTSNTAPGQPTLADLKQTYRWDKLAADTRVYGVIGHPVGHSMSPAIHNAGFDAVDYNGVYLPMPIPTEYEHFKATVASWLAHESLHFRGASVTIPHKENLLRFVREQGGDIEPLAEMLGVANTLAVRDDGSLYASNTDYAGALDAVCDALSIQREALADKRVAVVGAGGAARAVVAGFANAGATVVIYNRTFEKAQQIADDFGDLPGKVVAARVEKLCDSCCEVFINCTPLGMHPHVDATPMPVETMTSKGKGWGPGTVVFDTIYNPIETRLLREAKQAGCVTIPGTEMFVRQGAAQFEGWTGEAAPLDVFRRVLNEKLAARA